jgi:hypothetical protein
MAGAAVSDAMVDAFLLQTVRQRARMAGLLGRIVAWGAPAKLPPGGKAPPADDASPAHGGPPAQPLRTAPAPSPS